MKPERFSHLGMYSGGTDLIRQLNADGYTEIAQVGSGVQNEHDQRLVSGTAYFHPDGRVTVVYVIKDYSGSSSVRGTSDPEEMTSEEFDEFLDHWGVKVGGRDPLADIVAKLDEPEPPAETS